ncbi:uncharacterized protein [Penaeus vannamei]|uniref:uncharacterized protein n=1 Tax=Penaeus vannamei TaxID=6689 RepID=UPI00387F58AC
MASGTGRAALVRVEAPPSARRGPDRPLHRARVLFSRRRPGHRVPSSLGSFGSSGASPPRRGPRLAWRKILFDPYEHRISRIRTRGLSGLVSERAAPGPPVSCLPAQEKEALGRRGEAEALGYPRGGLLSLPQPSGLQQGKAMESSYEMKVLLWSVTCGVALILGLMVAITYLLLRQNKLLKARRSASSGPPPRITRAKSRRGPSKDEVSYLTPTGLPPPVSSIGRGDQPPRPKGVHLPMRHQPIEDSPASSLDNHIYEDADYMYEPDSESF